MIRALGDWPLDGNPHVAEVATLPEAFSREECRAALELAKSRPYERGHMLGRRDDARRCHCAWIEDDADTRWMYDRVVAAFEHANRTFDYRLGGLIEPVMAVAYGPEDGFDWHLDAGPERAATRKLSLSVMLTRPDDYDGGALEIAGANEAMRPELGTAIVFPSFLAHRVTPVTRGKRIALVAFAHGPTFR